MFLSDTVAISLEFKYQDPINVPESPVLLTISIPIASLHLNLKPDDSSVLIDV
jgi:hypothetical protein